MRAKQAVEYNIVFHPIRRTDVEPWRGAAFACYAENKCCLEFNAILTQRVVQQAAPANTQRAFSPKAFVDSNEKTVRAKEKYVGGSSREPPATSRVGIIHDERNKGGVLQQTEAAPLQRCAHPFMAPLYLSLFTFHFSPFTSEQDKPRLAPGVLRDPAPQPLPLHSIRSCGLIKPDRHELVCFFGTAHSRPDRPS